jgi:hypothetical protein
MSLEQENLDDDLPPERCLLGDEDVRHAAAAQLAIDAVSVAEGGLQPICEVMQGRM